MHLIPIPALRDNYIWLLHDDTGSAIVVDPGEAQPVHDTLRAHSLNLQAVLITHHHWDHTDGVLALRDTYQVPVYAPVDDRLTSATQHVRDGDELSFDDPAIRFRVMALPGHTRSHVAYLGAGMLLCGDTLFSIGCGRLFEGSAAQMLSSLDRIAALPGDTLVCAGHEYTGNNARFALLVDPKNKKLEARMQQVTELRSSQQPSLPSRLADELETNPFLRVDDPAITHWCARQGIVDNDRVSRFAALRDAKDKF